MPWAVQKRLNRSICRLGCELGLAERRISSTIFARWRQCAHNVPTFATWRIRLNRPSAAAMRSYVKLIWPLVIIRPRRTYVDAAYCYRPSNVVCRSVCLSVCHTSEPCKNGWTDRDAVLNEESGGSREPCVRWGSWSPHGNGQFFLRGKGRPIVKYRDTPRTSVQKRLNRSRFRLGYGLRWAQGIMY